MKYIFCFIIYFCFFVFAKFSYASAVTYSQPAYLGCFQDSTSGGASRVMKGLPAAGNSNCNGQYCKWFETDTLQQCVTECRNRSFSYAGLQFGKACFCGNITGASAPLNDCNTPCPGDSSKKCGGGYRNSVYDVRSNTAVTASVQALTVSPTAGTYTTSQNVTLSTSTPQAQIRYTLDGSEPTVNTGSDYNAAISISSTKTLKAKAFKSGFNDSALLSAVYTINTPPPPQQIIIQSISPTNQTVALSGKAQVVVGAAGPGTLIYTWYKGTRSQGVNGTLVSGGNTSTLSIDNFQASSVGTYYVGVKNTAGMLPVFSQDVTVSLQAAVATPAASLIAGSYSSPQTVVLTTATSGAQIRYTLDGSEPTANSGMQYATPISITTSQVLKAKAFKSGLSDSALLSSAYIINLGVVATPVVSPVSGSYTVAQTVTLTTATSGAQIKYTLDGSEPTPTTGIVYSSPFLIATSKTLKAKAFKSGFSDSALLGAAYTINLNVVNTTVATPIANPGGGTYTSSQNVTLTTATSGAQIRYTLDGSDPTVNGGMLYNSSSPISITSTKTLKARAFKSGSTDSLLLSVTYTINTITSNAYDYVGCFQDSTSGGSTRVMKGLPAAGNSNCNGQYCIWYESNPNPLQACISECRTRGFTYAGMQFGKACFCGNSTGAGVPATDCNITCAGEPNNKCGAAYKNSVYRTATVAVAQTCASPLITGPSGNQFSGTSTNITISSGNIAQGCTLQYSLTPTGVFTNYTAPFSINATTTVRAKAVKTGFTSSAEVSLTVTKVTSAPNVITMQATPVLSEVSSINMGNMLGSQNTLDVTVTLKNIGNANAQINTAPSFTSGSGFSLVSWPTTLVNIAPSATYLMTLRFNRQGSLAGSQSSHLSINVAGMSSILSRSVTVNVSPTTDATVDEPITGGYQGIYVDVMSKSIIANQAREILNIGSQISGEEFDEHYYVPMFISNASSSSKTLSLSVPSQTQFVIKENACDDTYNVNNCFNGAVLNTTTSLNLVIPSGGLKRYLIKPVNNQFGTTTNISSNINITDGSNVYAFALSLSRAADVIETPEITAVAMLPAHAQVSGSTYVELYPVTPIARSFGSGFPGIIDLGFFYMSEYWAADNYSFAIQLSNNSNTALTFDQVTLDYLNSDLTSAFIPVSGSLTIAGRGLPSFLNVRLSRPALLSMGKHEAILTFKRSGETKYQSYIKWTRVENRVAPGTLNLLVNNIQYISITDLSRSDEIDVNFGCPGSIIPSKNFTFKNNSSKTYRIMISSITSYLQATTETDFYQKGFVELEPGTSNNENIILHPVLVDAHPDRRCLPANSNIKFKVSEVE